MRETGRQTHNIGRDRGVKLFNTEDRWSSSVQHERNYSSALFSLWGYIQENACLQRLNTFLFRFQWKKQTKKQQHGFIKRCISPSIKINTMPLGNSGQSMHTLLVFNMCAHYNISQMHGCFRRQIVLFFHFLSRDRNTGNKGNLFMSSINILRNTQ